jgi:hypothetical protein
MWAAAAVATAAILVAIYFSRPQSRAPQIVQHPRQQEAPSPVEQRGPAPGPKVNASGQTPPSGGTQRVQNTADSTRQVVAIRQEVFPSPSPLSEQEKLLFRYMARTPREELVSQSHPDPPQAEDGGTDLKDGSPNNLTQVQQHSSNTR